MSLLGWGGKNEARAEDKAKGLQAMNEANVREEMRKAREARLERELTESTIGGPEDEIDCGTMIASVGISEFSPLL